MRPKLILVAVVILALTLGLVAVAPMLHGPATSDCLPLDGDRPGEPRYDDHESDMGDVSALPAHRCLPNDGIGMGTAGSR